MVRSTLLRQVFRPDPGSKIAKSQICTRALEFYISNIAESKSVNDLFIRQRLGGRENQDFDRKISGFDTFRRFSQGKRTNRNLPHRYLESPRSNLYSKVPFASRALETSCYRRVVFTNFGGNFGISRIPKNFDLELISKGLELPESHWTSPLGPLAGVVGWVL